MGVQHILNMTTICLHVFLLIISLCDGYDVQLTRLSTLYLPTYDADGVARYPYPSNTGEQLAFEPRRKIVYAVGEGHIHVIDASDVNNLTYVDHVPLAQLDLTGVEVCGEVMIVSYKNNSDLLNGGVRVYRHYESFSRSMELIHDIPMGALPDMVAPTPDCTILVAVENEGVIENGLFHDQPGGVGIIRFPTGFDNQPEVKLLDFSKFDNIKFADLSKQGVRWVFRGNNNSFSNSIEPEYIAFNHDYSKAYVSLQENNAVAEVDMRTEDIVAIHGLGYKQWGKLDPSDRDGGVRIREWPLYGMYQPDSIRCVRWADQDYVITANEGDSVQYPTPVNFDEEIRAKDIQLADIAPSVPEELKAALQNDTLLGRLILSNVDGKNSDGKYERFYTYGARSFSIWRASDMAQVYDSGSQMEEKLAQVRPDIFNANSDAAKTLLDTVDTRSDNRGPETESIALGKLGGRLLIFVGNERPGTIAVYSVAPGGMLPEFETLYTQGIPQDKTRTWDQMHRDRDLYAIDPEFMRFFKASEMAEYPVLLMGGSVSGTVTVLKVDFSDETNGGSNSAPQRLVSFWFQFIVAVLCCFIGLSTQ